jgi:hypothetical protein
MSGELRCALIVGVVLAFVYLAFRHFRSEGIQGTDVAEAGGIAVTPLFIPGAIEMVVKAFGGATLPIFNSAEDRVALVFGGLILIVAFLYGNLIALQRAWRNKRG